jgi:hypothetical protein
VLGGKGRAQHFDAHLRDFPDHTWGEAIPPATTAAQRTCEPPLLLFAQAPDTY